MPNSPRVIHEFGPYCLDPVERRFSRDGEAIILRNKVFDLLVILARNHAQLLSNARLLKEVWGEEFGGSDYKVAATINELRRKLGEDDYIQNEPGHGYRFTAQVRTRNQTPAALPAQSGAPTPGGAVPLGSPFYIERETDADFFAAMARRDSIVLVKGPPQAGKTSLLARGVQRAREDHAEVILTDLRLIEHETLANSEALFLILAEEIADKLGLATAPHDIWNNFLNPIGNFQRYFQRHVLEKFSQPLVWAIDDVDELFKCRHSGEIFGMFRWWHNLRALEPSGPWRRLTLALAYATEAHLFITDVNQSPFNVGTQVTLEDFTFEQTAKLVNQYGGQSGEVMITEQDAGRFFNLLGGHPYLIQRGLYEMSRRKLEPAAIEARADHDDGIFGDHLRRMRFLLERDPELCAAMREFLQGQPLSNEQFYRLRSAGLIKGDSAGEARPRCELYARYLKKHLL